MLRDSPRRSGLLAYLKQLRTNPNPASAAAPGRRLHIPGHALQQHLDQLAEALQPDRPAAMNDPLRER